MQVAGLVHDLGKLLYFFGSEYVSLIHPRGAKLIVFLVFAEANGMLLGYIPIAPCLSAVR